MNQGLDQIGVFDPDDFVIAKGDLGTLKMKQVTFCLEVMNLTFCTLGPGVYIAVLYRQHTKHG